MQFQNLLMTLYRRSMSDLKLKKYLLNLADQALYMAKETGRSRVCYWKDDVVETVLVD